MHAHVHTSRSHIEHGNTHILIKRKALPLPLLFPLVRKYSRTELMTITVSRHVLKVEENPWKSLRIINAEQKAVHLTSLGGSNWLNG